MQIEDMRFEHGLLSLDIQMNYNMRLRRIKDRLKEMNKWWNEVMSEEEKHDDEMETKKRDNEEEEEEEEEKEKDDEETVGVERVGDSMTLKLKCSCGKRFEILLSGRNCFYKLL
uniref:Uncharacterized protein n=1 Tax=Cucumis melo TaxID=3656 RepID=A0A9I9CH16_CUCME